MKTRSLAMDGERGADTEPAILSPGQRRVALLSGAGPLVVQVDYLINTLGLTQAFIKEHSRKMGSFGRPRNFLLSNVLRHLEELAFQSMLKAHTPEAGALRQDIDLDRLWQEVMAGQACNADEIFDSAKALRELKAKKKERRIRA